MATLHRNNSAASSGSNSADGQAASGLTLVIHDGGLPSFLALAMSIEASGVEGGGLERTVAWVPGAHSPLWADASVVVGGEQADILARTAARSLGVRLMEGAAWAGLPACRAEGPMFGLGVSLELIRAMMLGVELGAARVVWPVCPVTPAGAGSSALARMFALGERARLVEALASLDGTAAALGVGAAGHGIAGRRATPVDPKEIVEPPALETPFLDLAWLDLLDQAQKMGLPLDLCWGPGPMLSVPGRT